MAPRNRVLAVALAVALVAFACGDDDVVTTSVAEPTPEEFAAAADCDTLNELLVRADAARFWEYAELTVAEAEAMRAEESEGGFEPEPDFEPSDIDRAFSDRQAELNCSDAGMMAALQTAIRERCEAWLETHSADEDPLLVNTAFCLGVTLE